MMQFTLVNVWFVVFFTVVDAVGIEEVLKQSFPVDLLLFYKFFEVWI